MHEVQPGGLHLLREALAIGGIFVGYGLTSAATSAQSPKVDRAATEAEILIIAADYASGARLFTHRSLPL